MNLDASCTKCCRGLQSDEACADDERTAGFLGPFDNRAAVGERAKRMDVGLVGARDWQPHRFCAIANSSRS